jgi:hypothetical protein
MRTRPCRLVLLSLLCLATLATPAAAESAWVVWLTLITFDTTGKATLADTSPLTGSQSKADCVVLLKAWIRDRIEGAKERVVKGQAADRYSVILLAEDGSRTDFALTCLPDTIDPRGPKGK